MAKLTGLLFVSVTLVAGCRGQKSEDAPIHLIRGPIEADGLLNAGFVQGARP